VFDARPKANAMANQAKGAGYERQDIYKNTRFKFLGIDNIHVVRDSHRKLYEQCHPFNINEGNNQVPFSTPAPRTAQPRHLRFVVY
jgi:hypothetical protein